MKTVSQSVKISVIIPVYNAESYLKEAIESVLVQKYPDYELLLVENGSSDRSPLIGKEYEKKYDQIRLLQEPVQGVGMARNRGLREAKGEYICFVDADDRLSDEYVLGDLLSEIEKAEADVAVGNYKRLWDGKLLAVTGHQEFSGEDPESENFRFQGFFSVGTLSYVWGKLYRRAFLTEHEIRFWNREYAEDKLFNLQCYTYHPRYVFADRCVYIYRKNPDSISFQYRPDSICCWHQISADTDLYAKGQPQYGNLSAYILFFAVFFDAKMEYVEKQRSIRAIHSVLFRYMDNPIGKKAFRQLAKGVYGKQLHIGFWKSGMRIFAIGMVCHCYGLLALGIKLLIDLRVDERLSDTGLRD